jgi:hypothetical protein
MKCRDEKKQVRNIADSKIFIWWSSSLKDVNVLVILLFSSLGWKQVWIEKKHRRIQGD